MSLLLFGLTCAAAASPHILVIVADDLGWNDVDFHGSAQIPTPHLTKLAREGIILDNYYVQPVCSPTRSSLLTGRHVIHTGIYDPDCDHGTTFAVPFNMTMLPLHLQKLGYETHAVGKWHLGIFSRRVIPTAKGFGTFFGFYGGGQDYFTHVDSHHNDMHDDVGDDLRAVNNSGVYSTFLYADRASKIITDFAAKNKHDSQKKLFIYLAFQAIHSPDEVPELYSNRFIDTIPDTSDGVGKHRRTVAGMAACLDEGIGNITATLDKAGMLEDTLIVFTTDNGGPAQGFDGNMASNWPLRGMKRTLWQGGIRGTGFIHGAGLQKTGYVSRELMHVTDWFPTLITAAQGGASGVASGGAGWKELVGAGSGGEPAWQLGDGMDVWEMLSTGAPSPRTEVIVEAHPADMNADDGNGQAIIMGDLKLILEKGPQWPGPPNDLWYESGSNPHLYNHTVKCGPAPASGPLPPALFNISSDPCEYVDLRASQPADYQRLLARLAAYQITAVAVGHHRLPMCEDPVVPISQPINGTWGPVCP